MTKRINFSTFLKFSEEILPVAFLKCFRFGPSVLHLEPYLELFEFWEIMVLQIIITIIANVINFKQLLLRF